MCITGALRVHCSWGASAFWVRQKCVARRHLCRAPSFWSMQTIVVSWSYVNTTNKRGFVGGQKGGEGGEDQGDTRGWLGAGPCWRHRDNGESRVTREPRFGRGTLSTQHGCFRNNLHTWVQDRIDSYQWADLRAEAANINVASEGWVKLAAFVSWGCVGLDEVVRQLRFTRHQRRLCT